MTINMTPSTDKRVTIADKYNGLITVSPLYNVGIDPKTLLHATEAITMAIRVPIGYGKIIKENALMQLQAMATAAILPASGDRTEADVTEDGATQAMYLAAHEAGAWFFALSSIVEGHIRDNEAVYCSDFDEKIAEITLRIAPLLAELKFCEEYIAEGVTSPRMLAMVETLKGKIAELETEKKVVYALNVPSPDVARAKEIAKTIATMKKPNRMGANFFATEAEWLDFANRRYDLQHPITAVDPISVVVAVVDPIPVVVAVVDPIPVVVAESFEDELAI